MTQPLREETTVVIVGGGVAGLTAAMLLRCSGIDAIVLERQPRAYVEQRQRAGVVEYRGVRMLQEWGLGKVLGTFPADNVMAITLDGDTILAGRDPHSQEHIGVTTPQQALVRNLVAAFIDGGGDLRFEARDVALHDLDSNRPLVAYTGADGSQHEIGCEFVAGCDGDHGVSRASIPDGALASHSREYGITWLTILAEAPPQEHAAFAVGKHGYAAHFARGPRASRLYLEIPATDTLADWPEPRIWSEVRTRFWRPGLPAGPVTETETFALRSQVFEPMSHGRLYLLGDAAHVISPMGAKGMNLALYDAEVFATAVRDHVKAGDDTGLRGYSGTCLARTWTYHEYANWMTDLLFSLCGQRADADPYAARLSRTRLARFSDPTSAAALAWGELITGLA